MTSLLSPSKPRAELHLEHNTPLTFPVIWSWSIHRFSVFPHTSQAFGKASYSSPLISIRFDFCFILISPLFVEILQCILIYIIIIPAVSIFTIFALRIRILMDVAIPIFITSGIKIIYTITARTSLKQ